jgi:hypothetical protein
MRALPWPAGGPSRRLSVEIHEELAVREPLRQHMPCVYGERRLPDSWHSVDHMHGQRLATLCCEFSTDRTSASSSAVRSVNAVVSRGRDRSTRTAPGGTAPSSGWCVGAARRSGTPESDALSRISRPALTDPGQGQLPATHRLVSANLCVAPTLGAPTPLSRSQPDDQVNVLLVARRE